MDLTDIVLALRAVDEGDLDRGDLSQLLSTLESWERGGLRASCAELLTREFRIDAQRVRRWESEIAGRPSRRVGKYLLRRRVGQGGMGVVFEAEHPNLSRPVALKILSPSQGRDPAAIQRFLREVKSAGRFNHPHIVHAYDAGIDGDVPYLVMEFVDGENLFQVLVRGGPIPFSSAIMWMRQATLALSVLEGKRWVHGDGKPSNWILAPGGILKLADLGLCGPPGKPRRDTHVRGTPPYIAPEQLSGRDPIDTRADLYSLGATFYHLLTGRPPHEARTVAELARAQRERGAPPPRSLRPEIPEDLARVVSRLLEPAAENRYQTCRELLEDLDALEGAPAAISDPPQGAEPPLQEELAASAPLARYEPPPAPTRRGGRRFLIGTSVALVAGGALIGLLGLWRGGRLAPPEKAPERQSLPVVGAPSDPSHDLLGADWAELWEEQPRDYPALAAWLEERAAADPREDRWRAHLQEKLEGEGVPLLEACEERIGPLLARRAYLAALRELDAFPERLRVGRMHLSWQERRLGIERQRRQLLARLLLDLSAAVAAEDPLAAWQELLRLQGEPADDRAWYCRQVRERFGGLPWLGRIEDILEEERARRAGRGHSLRESIRAGRLPEPRILPDEDLPRELALLLLERHPEILEAGGSPLDRLHAAGVLAWAPSGVLAELLLLIEAAGSAAEVDWEGERLASSLFDEARQACEAWNIDGAERAWKRLEEEHPRSAAQRALLPGLDGVRLRLRRGAFLREGGVVAVVEGGWEEPPRLRYTFGRDLPFGEWRVRGGRWRRLENGVSPRHGTEGELMELCIPFEECRRFEIVIAAPEPPWILLTGYGESAVGIARRPQGSPLILAGKREGLVERLGEGGDLWNGAADDFSAPLLRLTFMIEGRTWRVRAGEAEALLSRVSGPAPEWLWLVVPPGAVLRRITVEGAPDGSWLDARRELLSRDGGGGG